MPVINFSIGEELLTILFISTMSNKYNTNVIVLTNWYIDTVGACRRFANLIIKHVINK